MIVPGVETAVGIALIAGAGAVVLVALAVWLIRRRKPLRIDSPEDAAAAADTALAGFTTHGAVVGADGTGALAVDAGGRVAVMTRQGKRIVAREVAWAALRSTPGGILIDAGGQPVLVAGVDALDVRRLAPSDLKRMMG